MSLSPSPEPVPSGDIDLCDPARCPAYVNGRYCALKDVQLPALDRGFLFADGVYEVVPIYNGHLFRWPAHRARLLKSLGGLLFPDDAVDLDAIEGAAVTLAQSVDGYASLYLQISRGSYDQRDHSIPERVNPSVVMWLAALPEPSKAGGSLRLMAVDDIRWDWCHLKTVSLLGNVLAREIARRKGFDDALLVRKGRILEASAANVLLVDKGEVRVPDSSSDMLPGITRQVIGDLAEAAGIAHHSIEPPTIAEALAAEEVWLCSSTKLMLPVVAIDSHALAAPRCDGLGERLRRDFIEMVERYEAPPSGQGR